MNVEWREITEAELLAALTLVTGGSGPIVGVEFGHPEANGGVRFIGLPAIRVAVDNRKAA